MKLDPSFTSEPPMISIAELHPVLRDLFDDSARLLARDTGFCRRQRKLTGPIFAQSLVFTLLHDPHAALDDFADTASDLLGAPVSPQAFDQRFTPAAADFCQQLLLDAFNRSFTPLRPALLPLLRRFNGVFLRDGTLISLPAELAALLPGRGGRHAPHGQAAALKVVLEAEVSSGELTDVSLLPGLDNEKTAEVAGKPLPEKALLLEDMGFLSGQRLQTYVDQGVYVLTHIPAWTAVFDLKGQRLDLVQLLRRHPGASLEQQVQLFHGTHLELRLLAVRVPEQEAEQRRQRVRKEAQQRGRPVSQRKLDLCEWNILVTNVPKELLGAQEACVVRRVRWQIELVFKVFKSEGGVEQRRSARPARVLSELFAKLLGMVVQHWVLLAAGYQMLRHSARRASRRVRARALKLLQGVQRLAVLGQEVARLARVLHRRCRIVRRKAEPSTLDRLSAYDPEAEQIQVRPAA